MKVTFVQQAEPGTIFAPHCFDGSIGKQVNLAAEPGGRVLGGMTVQSAVVSEDGQSVTIEGEMDAVPVPLITSIGGLSL